MTSSTASLGPVARAPLLAVPRRGEWRQAPAGGSWPGREARQLTYRLAGGSGDPAQGLRVLHQLGLVGLLAAQPAEHAQDLRQKYATPARRIPVRVTPMSLLRTGIDHRPNGFRFIRPLPVAIFTTVCVPSALIAGPARRRGCNQGAARLPSRSPVPNQVSAAQPGPSPRHRNMARLRLWRVVMRHPGQCRNPYLRPGRGPAPRRRRADGVGEPSVRIRQPGIPTQPAPHPCPRAIKQVIAVQYSP
jgi:hypothetical protein